MTQLSRHLLLASVILLAASCAKLPTRPDIPPEAAMAPATTGRLAELLVPAEAAHPGQSGFRLVGDGGQAYALRVRSAQAAVRSLDIQTYIWHQDTTGMLIAKEALDAADRGVHVRILLDDMDARIKNKALAALDAHPNIEVRLFNPFASRSGKASAVGELVSGGMKRLNRRMHNKTWIADGRVALVGGRNLGDEYFDASEETNFIDLDMVMAGPVVREISAGFDRYWNSAAVWPISKLSPELVSSEALARLRPALDAAPTTPEANRYAKALEEDRDVQRLVTGQAPLAWSGEWAFISDDPMKALRKEPGSSSVVEALTPVIRSATTSVAIASPYFVPGEEVTAGLVARATAGINVRVLTNSLAATDVAAVHGGYTRYRKDLLRGGVKLWELKPTGGSGKKNFSLYGSSGSSLHSKSFIVDTQRLFVGSYNLDPRSTALNCEQGVLVTDPAMAAALEAIFDRQLLGKHAWQVQLDDDGLRWDDGSKTWREEPEAGGSRKFQAWLSRLLPVESQL